MAYSATGTAGNDTLNQSGDSGPGIIVGLGGDDTILTGSGLASVTGGSGNDSVLLRTGNTGTVTGATENDSIFGPAGIGSMQLFGNAGNDTIDYGAASSAQTVGGGDDSSDGADSILGGTGADIVFLNGGNDSMDDFGGANTLIGGFGNDQFAVDGANLIFGNEGNDSINTDPGTVWGGLGNDSVFTGGDALVFGNEGSDTIDTSPPMGNATVVGGNDSADGADSIFSHQQVGVNTLFAFGNGGADTFDFDIGAATLIGGQGSDSFDGIVSSRSLFFGNEGNATLNVASSQALTVFGGLGDDFLSPDDGHDTIQGNEGNDTLRGDEGIDTISGGSGNDVFEYQTADDDGDNATGGGPVEFLTDVSFNVDRFEVFTPIVFAANLGAGTGANLNEAANNALNASAALSGNAANFTAAQFTFGGRTYLAIDQSNAGLTRFDDLGDLLLDITGAIGTISAGNFI